MRTDRNSLKITILPALLIAVALVVSWAFITKSVPLVSGDHGIEGRAHLTEVDEDQDEIDPEACATVIEKELEGPIRVSATSTVLRLPDALDELRNDILREQMIIKVIQACNVDDEVRPPNLERDLDVDIEVFSIICEKRDDLSVAARCEVLRVAQKENADFLQ